MSPSLTSPWPKVCRCRTLSPFFVPSGSSASFRSPSLAKPSPGESPPQPTPPSQPLAPLLVSSPARSDDHGKVSTAPRLREARYGQSGRILSVDEQTVSFGGARHFR